jgi:hypothetical protein
MNKQNKKGKNLYKQRIPKGLNLNIKRCRQQALLDITEDCGKDKFFTRNYASIEHVVLSTCKIIQETLPITNYKLYIY